MKNRCILSLLICCFLLYYALPELQLRGNSLSVYFSWTWLSLLIMAFAGNLAAVLFAPKKTSKLFIKLIRNPREKSNIISVVNIYRYQNYQRTLLYVDHETGNF